MQINRPPFEIDCVLYLLHVTALALVTSGEDVTLIPHCDILHKLRSFFTHTFRRSCGKGRKSGFWSYWYHWIELENTRRLVPYIIMSVPDLVV